MVDIIVPHNTTPFVTAYPWTTGFGVKYADPATLPGSAGLSADFSPAVTDVAIGSNATPFVQVYPWASGFGVKYANPATLQQTLARV